MEFISELSTHWYKMSSGTSSITNAYSSKITNIWREWSGFKYYHVRLVEKEVEQKDNMVAIREKTYYLESSLNNNLIHCKNFKIDYKINFLLKLWILKLDKNQLKNLQSKIIFVWRNKVSSN